jgi:hypothetical protein
VAIGLELAGTHGVAAVLVGFAVTVVTHLLGERAAAGPRRRCERAVACAVRSILDRHLDLTRIDAVGFGDFLTLRHLAAASRAGGLDQIIGFGGPAQALSIAIDALVGELEDEVGRCYLLLRPHGREKVDGFARALRGASNASAAMMQVPLVAHVADREPADARLFADLAIALGTVEHAGDDLDRTFDLASADAAAAARKASAEERQRREGHAAGVLLKNARDAAAVLQLPSVQHAVRLPEPGELVRRLDQARGIMLTVDALAFTDATDEARAAHRRLTHEDLGIALEVARRLEINSSDADAAETLRSSLGRFPSHLKALEDIRDRRPQSTTP